MMCLPDKEHKSGHSNRTYIHYVHYTCAPSKTSQTGDLWRSCHYSTLADALLAKITFTGLRVESVSDYSGPQGIHALDWQTAQYYGAWLLLLCSCAIASWALP